MTKDSAQALPIIRFLDAEDGRPPRGLPHWAALPDDFVLALQLMHLRSAAPPLACDEANASSRSISWRAFDDSAELPREKDHERWRWPPSTST